MKATKTELAPSIVAVINDPDSKKLIWINLKGDRKVQLFLC
jgi:hypothetical protein